MRILFNHPTPKRRRKKRGKMESKMSDGSRKLTKLNVSSKQYM